MGAITGEVRLDAVDHEPIKPLQKMPTIRSHSAVGRDGSTETKQEAVLGHVVHFVMYLLLLKEVIKAISSTWHQLIV